MSADSGLLFLTVMGVQILGLCSLAGARLYQDCHSLPYWQLLFFVLLLLVGGATCTTLVAGSPLWLPCGGTLAVMILGATFDPCRAPTEIHF